MSLFSKKPIIKELNPWQDELILGSKKTVIQRGDVIFVTGENIEDITGVFGSAVILITHNPYYHVMLYDHAWRFVHAGWPKVESRDLRSFYLKKPNVTLTWGRPKHDNGDPITAEQADMVISFAEEQIGKSYDVLANLSFVFRSDGLPEIPLIIQQIFKDRNWLEDRNKWHCSELVGAALFHGADIAFVEDMKNKTYLSPADIYDSLYQDVVCTLKIKEGKPQLLTK